MTYLDWLKRHDNFDKYVLFLLSLGFTVKETAELVGMSRQAIYDLLERNAKMIDEYKDSMKGLLKKEAE